MTLVRLTHDDISIRKFGKERAYRWDEIKRVVIRRPTLEHEGFTELRCDVGDCKFTLTCRGHDKRYIGSPPSRIASFFETYAPPDSLVIYTEEDPQFLPQVEEEIASIRRQIRHQRALSWLSGVGMPLYLIIQLAAEGSLREIIVDRFSVAALILSAAGIILWLMVPFLYGRYLHQREQDLLRKQRELRCASRQE